MFTHIVIGQSLLVSTCCSDIFPTIHVEISFYQFNFICFTFALYEIFLFRSSTIHNNIYEER